MQDISAVNPNDEEGQPSKLDRTALYGMLRDWFKADMAHSAEWRANAKKEFDFSVGLQWEAKDKSTLDDAGRPVITFNRCLAMIKAVAGIEINGRHDTVFLPRGTSVGEVKVNELLSGASQWMADGCDAEDEQSEAFQDLLVCGMGWTEPRISHDDDPDGMYVETKVDPLEMYWDKAARSKNLIDARRIFRVRKMQLDEARALAESMGAKVLDEDLNAAWAIGADTDPAKPVEEKRLRSENSGQYDPKAEVHIVHAQWWEREAYYRIADGATGQEIELTEEKFKQYRAIAKQHGVQYDYVKQTRKVFKQAFLGGEIIGEVTPSPAKKRFTFQCMTGERDRNAGTWFGLVRLMRDPQMWANKWLSQTLHILNTTAKGGIIAEADAFKDQREAQDTYALPDAITWAAKGAISQNKIMQKPGVGIPAGYINLLEFAISSIRDVTGINLELLGLRDANQPGVLEAQRKQAGMTILATMFDSLRRFRKNIGRVRLVFIQDYLSDGRLIRIAGEGGDGMRMVPLIRDQTIGDFEVIIDDAPTSPNQKQETWQMIKEIMPVFRDMMTPESVIAILEYSPLPSKLVQAFKDMAKKPPPPEAIEKQQVGKAAAVAKIEVDRSTAAKNDAAAEATRAKAILDLVVAGSTAAAANINLAAQQVMTPEPWGHEDPIQPMPQQGGNVLPGMPQMMPTPAVPNGGPPQPQGGMNPDLMSLLAAQQPTG